MAKLEGHYINCVDLYKENFDPAFKGENPDEHKKFLQDVKETAQSL